MTRSSPSSSVANPRIGEPADRIQSLDVLRGLALFGMIVVHFHGHTLEIGGVNDFIRTVIWRLIEEKSHGTFALLFGAGFAIQLRRADARGEPLAGRYLRRLAVLLLFGIGAHAGFGYNVLIGYAVWGAPLLLIRRWSTRALIITAIVSAMTVPLYWLMTDQYRVYTLGPERAAAAIETDRAVRRDVYAALDAAEAGDSYRELLGARLNHMAWFYRQPFFVMPGATLALFIVGLLLARHEFFERPSARRRVLAGLMIFGLVSWIVDVWLMDVWPQIGPLGLVFRNQWLTFTYVGAFLLVVAPRAAWMSRLRPLALAGRMALTNYLLQIAVIDMLFSGYGAVLPDIRPVVGLLASALLFSALVVFSWFWLRRFRFGPAEWVWRSLTYGEMQPLRRLMVSERTGLS